LLNLQTGQWDSELCEIFGVPPEVLPEIVPTTGELGGIATPHGRIAVRASVVDQQASLYGHGCRNAGDTKITFGTGAFALVVTGNQPQRSPAQGLLPTIAWEIAPAKPVYALDGGVYCAGSAVDWSRKLGLFDDYREINQFERVAAIDRDLVFVPALSGLACPHWDRNAAGLWIGMSLETDRRDLVQALLEGVALRAAEVIRAMGQFATISERISIDGGVSVNPYFCQFLANVLNRRVSVNAMAEVTALGTAMLAAGGELERPLVDAKQREYLPVADMSACLERFALAVTRASGWRQ
jgi:glycerol kinase